MHIEFLIEEESCAEALRVLVPQIVNRQTTFDTHIFQGKPDLLAALPRRLRGYQKWLPPDWRIVVLVDRDDDDCEALKEALEAHAHEAHLVTRSASADKKRFQVLNRIAIEELEAWFLGDVEALVAAYPGVPPTLAQKRGYRDCDGMSGGTWEALERVLKKAGHYGAGMPKIEVARNVSKHMRLDRNRSRSFKAFCDGLREMVA
jgi:hypothetical protein